jgi:hypothetical protein
MNSDRFSPVLVLFVIGVVATCGVLFAEAMHGWFVQIVAVIR